jgi:WD40 repeat protein
LPQQDRLAARSAGAIQLFDVPSKRFLSFLRATGINLQQFAVSPDGKLIVASGMEDNVSRYWIWKTDTFTPIVSRRPTHGANADVQMAFSPDNRLLATAGLEGPVYCWNVAGGEQFAVFPEEQHVYDLEFSPDGQTLATTSGNDVALWDVRSAKLVATLQGHTEACHGLAYSPDGRLLATVSKDQTVRLWHIPTWQQLGVLTRHSLPLSRVQFLTPRHLAVFSEPDPNDPGRANDVLLFDATDATGDRLTRLQ